MFARTLIDQIFYTGEMKPDSDSDSVSILSDSYENIHSNSLRDRAPPVVMMLDLQGWSVSLDQRVIHS